VSTPRRGYLYGIAAYACWGFFPLYWKLLRPAGAIEILAHRVLWSVVFVAVVLSAVRRWGPAAALARRRRTAALIAAAAILIAVNWGTYIYGVNSDHVVETSLGYFINPLVTVLLGVFVLRERLRSGQWVALGTGAAAVAVITVDYGRPPWIALVLAVSFGCYGLVKKRLNVPPVEGLLLESAILAPLAVGYLGWLAGHHRLVFGHVSVPHTTLLVLAGAVTAVPLLLFAGAANSLPLSALGLLQYIAPILQLACGVVIYHEPMPPARLIGFGLVWAALAVFSWDGIRQARATRAERAALTAAAA
jgi:chloramphenicol-sensitive protein RarD